MLPETDGREARRLIQSLMQSGQPPKHGASLFNVGTEKWLDRLQQEHLEDFLLPYEGQDGGGLCRWVEADYGNGKTQFLRCLQERAWKANYVTAFVELSQDECPLDRPERIYGAIARAIQASPANLADIDRSRGIEVTLQQLLDRMFPGVLSGLPSDDLKSQALDWVTNSFRHTPVEDTAFIQAATQHLTAQLTGDEEKTQLSAMFLRGENLPAAQAKTLGVYEKLKKDNGFRLLRSMCQAIQRSGLAAGTVFLFDEARRSLSLMSVKSQKIACENLLSVINRCNSGELPGTMFVYAVMPEFFTDFAIAYPALQQRCGPNTRINLNELTGIKESELLSQIGEKITGLFQMAYGCIPDQGPLTRNLKTVAAESIRKTMGTGTRRTFVRSWLEVLLKMRDGALELSPEQIRKLMEGVVLELETVEDSQHASNEE